MDCYHLELFLTENSEKRVSQSQRNYNLNVSGWHFILLLHQDQDHFDDLEDLEDLEDLHTRLYYRPTLVTYNCDILVLDPFSDSNEPRK